AIEVAASIYIVDPDALGAFDDHWKWQVVVCAVLILDLDQGGGGRLFLSEHCPLPVAAPEVRLSPGSKTLRRGRARASGVTARKPLRGSPRRAAGRSPRGRSRRRGVPCGAYPAPSSPSRVHRARSSWRGCGSRARL